jgi:uncharacterized protein YggL (DUF469 family)
MRVLTKRNLVLGNVVLGLVFALVAYSAIRPLLWPRTVVANLEVSSQEASSDVTLAAEKKAYEDKENEYPRVILSNNIFAAKVPKPKERKPVVTPPPIQVPNWTLAGIWEPDPGVFEATVIDKSKRTPTELVMRKGMEILEYQVVITEVTADYVRYEIRDKEFDRVVEQFLPESARRTAGPRQKDWSGIIEAVRRGDRVDYYAVNLTRFEDECKKLAGEDSDWVQMLIDTVEAEEYRPGGEDAALQGYKVLSFEPESPLDELGVEPQDIIVGLAAKPIQDEQQGRALLREALGQSQVLVHINRLGRSIIITVKLIRL